MQKSVTKLYDFIENCVILYDIVWLNSAIITVSKYAEAPDLVGWVLFAFHAQCQRVLSLTLWDGNRQIPSLPGAAAMPPMALAEYVRKKVSRNE